MKLITDLQKEENMTREEANKALPTLQAFAEGKVIQMLDDRSIWTDLTEREGLPIGTLGESPNIFRIKPEPNYRPFASAEECWQEMQKHQPFGWIKAIPNKEYKVKYYPNSKDDTALYYQVQKVAPGYIKYDDINDCCEIGEQDKSYKDVFKVITFADGTPFGILEEE